MKKSRLMDLINAAALALGLCMITAQASAAVVCVGSDTIATSCSGVEYNGTTYNVTWILPDYPASPTPIFGTSTPQTDSGPVTDAINSGLDAGGYTNIQYDTPPTGTSNAALCDAGTAPCFYVPYEIYTNTVGSWESKYTAGTGWSRDPTDDGNGNGPSLYYWNFAAQNIRPVAVFTPAAVPVPAALSLFLSGTALVGWLGRGRRQVC